MSTSNEDTIPLRVSDRARSRLLGILEEARGGPGEHSYSHARVRLFAEAVSDRAPHRTVELALAIDQMRPGDRPIDDDALPLVADDESRMAVAGHLLDYEETLAFHGFTLTPLARRRSCVPPDFAE